VYEVVGRVLQDLDGDLCIGFVPAERRLERR